MAQIAGEPGVGLGTRGGGQDRLAPDGDAQHLGAAGLRRRGHAQGRVPGGGHRDRAAAVGVADGDQGQRRLLALADEPAGRLDQEPAAIARQAPGLDLRLVNVDRAARLHRVDVNRVDAGGRSVAGHHGLLVPVRCG